MVAHVTKISLPTSGRPLENRADARLFIHLRQLIELTTSLGLRTIALRY